ncbi:tRNA nucleotidyltransferase [Cordyceps javanica]|uniref:tRNA nucleotidyltransferase n=1 Tax=Cordyceps javanica TaxID=43265 RepID=A0A545VH79_9HYPO|nr:tRNA nucleotidyltransferase [Cordyceps javanica]TQW12250.1 tRNA nucleotidyltransferase [Cordyceps javanica]
MSKQLETAGGKLFGLDVDLVNLRKEVYDGQTRNPDMEFGTAEEDAHRRDATVNALFFHLQRQQVVDLTGRGLNDLDAKIMRTPLEPMQTFMDDPLRVLRLIRVGSKLGFSIDPEAVSCMRNTRIHQALETMITRDRVGAEVMKMMRSRNPEAAFDCIFRYHLYAPIFVRLDAKLLQPLAQQFPFMAVKSSFPWPTTWPRAYQLLANILQGDSRLSSLVATEENVDFLWTVAAYSPLAGLRHSLLKETVQEAAASIKTTSKLTQLLDSSLKNFDSIRKLVHDIQGRNAKCCSRSAYGMAIRSWGATWTTQVTYVMLSQAVYGNLENDTEGGLQGRLSADEHVRESVLDVYSTFAEFIFSQNLLDAHSKRPLLNGKEIQDLFGLKEGGKYLKAVMDKLMEWQFDNADATREQGEAWLQQERDTLGVPSN